MPWALGQSGKMRAITQVATTWVKPAPWWAEPVEGVDPQLSLERIID